MKINQDRIQEIAREIYQNLGQDNLLLALDQEGATQLLGRGEVYLDPQAEEAVLARFDLSTPYWADALADWGLEEEEADPGLVEAFTQDVLVPLVEEAIRRG